MIDTFNLLLSLGALVLLAGVVVAIIGMLTKQTFMNTVARHSHVLLRVIFAGAMLGSLIYDLGFGYTPCLLCWYQRIAIFSIAILSFTADLRTSALLQKQVTILASLGAVFALFHNYIDIFPQNGLDVCGTGPSCLLRYVHEFGFVTIPLMSLIVLVSGIVLARIAKRYPQNPLV